MAMAGVGLVGKKESSTPHPAHHHVKQDMCPGCLLEWRMCHHRWSPPLGKSSWFLSAEFVVCGTSVWLIPDWPERTGTTPALMGKFNKAAQKLERSHASPP